MRVKFSIMLVGLVSIIGSMGTGVFTSLRDKKRLNAAQTSLEPIYQPKVWSDQDRQILRTLQMAGIQAQLDRQIEKIRVDGSAFNAQLSGVNLRGIFAELTNFSAADLSYANLSGAKLRSSTFSGTKLVGAQLVKADLRI